MRVLHVHSIAHIPELLVRELRARGVDAVFSEMPEPSDVRSCDIVHGHYALNRHTIRAFRLARRYGKPFVLHCHGSDLRLLTGTSMTGLPPHLRMVSQYMRKRSARIFLSTPDLTGFEPGGEYLPNPVDLERFRPMPGVAKSERTLLCGRFIAGSRVLEFIRPDREYDCVNTGDRIDWPPNVRVLPRVDYGALPGFLNRYTSMIGTIGDLISMARLEAMACGLRTFTDFDRAYLDYYDGQNPDEAGDPRAFVKRFHRPGIAVERLIAAYDDLA